MANERKMENIVRDFFRSKGYYEDSSIIIEEQISDHPRIDKLLSTASKKGKGKGYPEFLIRSQKYSDLIIVVECKANISKHESEYRDKYSEYAVDGVLLYSTFLSKEFDVLSIAVSGETSSNLRVSQYIQLNSNHKIHSFLGEDILSFEEYFNALKQSEIKFNQDYLKLLDYTKELNDLLHAKKIKESQRSLLISGILIALQNTVFRTGFTSHQKATQISRHLLSTIADEFSNANLPADKVSNLEQAFSFISTNTTLANDKDFFVTLIKGIEENVNNFMKTHEYFDTLGQFYIEFLRYANSDKGLGIVLTPPHITDLFSEIASVDKDSVVLDNCMGTGGFLISAMNKMVADAKGDKNKINSIKKKQLIGIEYQDDIYALGISNMIIHGDGKTNVILGDCFEQANHVREIHKPDIGFLNPPYKSKRSDIEELDFVLNNISALKKGGTCIAIVPLSCALASRGAVFERKKTLLENHTIKAILSMPEELFHNSKVSVVTCVFVITAHIPHPKGKKTWLGYWRDDSFVKTKGKGRIDLNDTWSSVRSKWLLAYINREKIDSLSLTRELTAKDEWCSENYLVANYDVINYKMFKIKVEIYLAYRLLNNLLNFEVKVINKKKSSQELVRLDKLFEIRNGLASSNVDVKNIVESTNDLRYIRPSQSYQGSIAGYVDKFTVDDKHIYPDETLYVSTDGQGSHSYTYVSSFDFVPNSNVSVLIPINEMSLQEKLYYAICVSHNRFKFSYGRKPKGERLAKLLLPETPPEFVFRPVFNTIFDNWKKVIK